MDLAENHINFLIENQLYAKLHLILCRYTSNAIHHIIWRTFHLESIFHIRFQDEILMLYKSTMPIWRHKNLSRISNWYKIRLIQHDQTSEGSKTKIINWIGILLRLASDKNNQQIPFVINFKRFWAINVVDSKSIKCLFSNRRQLKC